VDKKVANRIRSEETMAECWRLLDSFYSRPVQFAQDLLAEITAFKKIQYTDYDRLFEYYTLLCTIIKEARKVGLLSVLLTSVNIRIMEQALLAQEVELWRELQSRFSLDNHIEYFVEFVRIREDWALQNIAYVTTVSGGNAAPREGGQCHGSQGDS
jgi:hypothetical protein